MATLLTLTNPVFKNYVFYGSLLGAKMLAMAFLTGRQRFSKGVSRNSSFHLPTYLRYLRKYCDRAKPLLCVFQRSKKYGSCKHRQIQTRGEGRSPNFIDSFFICPLPPPVSASVSLVQLYGEFRKNGLNFLV